MRRWHVVFVALAFVLAACGTENGETEIAQEPPLPGSGVTVATTLYPFAWLTEEIAPGADIRLLADEVPTDPHDLELSPREMQELLSADVIVHVGMIGYQPQVERALGDAAGVVVSAIDYVDPLPLADPHHDHGHDDHGHDDHGHDDHESDDVDPHVWQSPAAMANIASGIVEALQAVDLEHRDAYEENAARISSELFALDAEIDEALGTCDLDIAIISHAGYTYVLTPRGIRQETITGPEGHGDPSPRRLAEVGEQARELGVPAILTEPIEGRRGAEALARDAGVPLVEIHPLGLVTPEQAERGYPDLVRENVDAFASALGCSDAPLLEGE